MSTLSTAARNAACNAAVDLVDAGAGAGNLIIRTSGGTTLVSFTLDDPAFGNAATGVATAAGFPKTATASASGTADNYQIRDSDNNVIISGTVGTSGTDIVLDNTSINNGQDVELAASPTHTQPAS
jgi:hypothetical protein